MSPSSFPSSSLPPGSRSPDRQGLPNSHFQTHLQSGGNYSPAPRLAQPPGRGSPLMYSHSYYPGPPYSYGYPPMYPSDGRPLMNPPPPMMPGLPGGYWQPHPSQGLPPLAPRPSSPYPPHPQGPRPPPPSDASHGGRTPSPTMQESPSLQLLAPHPPHLTSQPGPLTGGEAETLSNSIKTESQVLPPGNSLLHPPPVPNGQPPLQALDQEVVIVKKEDGYVSSQ